VFFIDETKKEEPAAARDLERKDVPGYQFPQNFYFIWVVMEL
jgi:hypothetical protein